MYHFKQLDYEKVFLLAAVFFMAAVGANAQEKSELQRNVF